MIDQSGAIKCIYLTEVSSKDKLWDDHRASAEKVQALYNNSDLQKYSNRIQQCSRFLGFALKAQDGEELKLKLHDARFCRVRYCPVCQWRRALMLRARFLAAVPKIIEAYPKGRWVFLTLTVKNPPVAELKQTLQRMNKAWERLSKRKQFPALGFVRSVEVTRSAIGEAHPHFHVLMLVPSSYFGGHYIKQQEWREMWQSVLRVDYLPVVNVKAVKARPGDSPESGLAKAVCETLKYGVKVSDLVADKEWLLEVTKQLHNTRAYSVGGVLKNFIADSEPDDLIGSDGEETGKTDIWFGWREMVKRYAKLESR